MLTHPLNWKFPKLTHPLNWKIRKPALVWSVPTFSEAAVFFFVALSPIQDSALQETPLKGLAASVSLLPMFVLIAITLPRWIAGGMNVKRITLGCCAYAALVTVYGFLHFGLASQGESLIVKSLTHFITFAVFLGAAFLPQYELRGAVRAGCFAAFTLLALGVFFSQGAPFGLPQLLEGSVFHYLPNADFGRPRGLSTESSTLSVTVIAIGLLCAHFSRTRRNQVFFVLATLGLLVVSASKGGIFILFICAGVLALMKWRRWYQVPVLAAALIAIGYTASIWVPRLFPEEGVEASGSVQTRASMVLTAVYVAEHYPLGVGFSGFIPAIREYLPDAMATMQEETGIPLIFTEAQDFLGSSEGIGTKTFFFDQLIRFGWPFAILFVVLTWKLLKRLAGRQWILFVAVLASVIAVCTYVGFTGEFATAILFGVAMRELASLPSLRGRQRESVLALAQPEAERG